ncbi:hypothetical protein HDU76_008683, partial [Blyttiomyces sp. JEL0837]
MLAFRHRRQQQQQGNEGTRRTGPGGISTNETASSSRAPITRPTTSRFTKHSTPKQNNNPSPQHHLPKGVNLEDLPPEVIAIIITHTPISAATYRILSSISK